MRLIALACLLIAAAARAGEPATVEEAEAALREMSARMKALEAEHAPSVADMKDALEPLAADPWICRGEKTPFVAVVAGYEWSFTNIVPFLRPLGLRPIHKYDQTRKIASFFYEDIGLANVETYSWVDEEEIVADVVKAHESGNCRPIVLLGYSYGGDTVSHVLNALKDKKIYVDLSIELDTIGRSDQKVPDNVAHAVCVYQETGPLNGNAKLVGGMTPPTMVNLGPIGHGAIARAPAKLIETIRTARAGLSYPGVNRLTAR